MEWHAVCEKLEAVGVYPASPHDGPSAYNSHTHEIAPVLLLRIVNSIAPVLSVMWAVCNYLSRITIRISCCIVVI